MNVQELIDLYSENGLTNRKFAGFIEEISAKVTPNGHLTARYNDDRGVIRSAAAYRSLSAKYVLRIEYKINLDEMTVTSSLLFASEDLGKPLIAISEKAFHPASSAELSDVHELAYRYLRDIYDQELLRLGAAPDLRAPILAELFPDAI